MSGLTHFDAAGAAHMVDVGDKPVTHRVAVAGGRIRMSPDTLAAVRSGSHKKGDVLGIARIAGIMAAKRTGELIPLCHPIGLDRVAVELDAESYDDAVECRVTTEVRSRTGVEMEAIVAVQTALATVYDMCKAIDRGMVIESVRLLEKRGGRSGPWRAEEGRAGEG